MAYRLEVPVPNHVHFTPRTLNAFIDKVEKVKQHVECLYFPLGHVDTDIDLWGIRVPDYVYQKDSTVDKQAVLSWEHALAQVLDALNLPVKILVNNIYSTAFYDADKFSKVLRKLNYYAERHEVHSLTIADSLAIPKFGDQGYRLTLSTNSHNSLAELDMILDSHGKYIKHVTLQRDLNRNPSKVKAFFKRRDFPMSRVVLMANEGCINACPYKQSGDVEISVDQVKSKQSLIHVQGCTNLMQHHDWTFLTSQFLDRQAIHQYYPDVKIVKLAGRNLAVSVLGKMFDHWVGDSDDLPLSSLMNVAGSKSFTIKQLRDDPEYWPMVMSCNKECMACRKCQTVYDRIPDISSSEA